MVVTLFTSSVMFMKQSLNELYIENFLCRELGELSNKAGACNCMTLGALPQHESKHQLRNEIELFKQSDSIESSEEEKTPFLQSVQCDLSSIQEMSQNIDLKSALRFVKTIEECNGNVMVSGIGEC